MDGSIDACEIHDCLIIAENEWRHENCVDTEDIFCYCPFNIAVCEGAWNCLDIYYVTEEVMMYLDTNNDGQINMGDDIDNEHLAILMEYCDFNGNETINSCEIHACVTMCENEWRADMCPEVEALYCGCPYEVASCPGAWTCSDVMSITYDVMSFYDSNADGSITLADNISEDHYAILAEYCDANGDNVVDACEVHACVVMAENEWRAENCPEYGDLYCECELAGVDCEGAWGCEQIDQIAVEAMAYFDTNNDGTVNANDNITDEELNELNMYCDLDGDNDTDMCEVH